jgi:hypothetical protein
MIQLSTARLFSHGGKRDCFIHPDHPDRCIKVNRRDEIPEELRRQSSWFRRLRKSAATFDQNMAEYEALARCRREPELLAHLPRLWGWEETDRGRGLVVEMIRDRNGEISSTLQRHIWNHGLDERARNALDELVVFWERHAIPAKDFYSHNLLAQDVAPDRLRLVLVDGFGSKEFIPLHRFSKCIAVRQARRRIRGLHAEIERLLDCKRNNIRPRRFQVDHFTVEKEP